MNRPLLGAVAVVLVAACSTEPSGSLTITLDATVPNATKATSVALKGTVTRTPPIKTVYTVTATRGTLAVADTVDSTGRFSITMALNADTANTFTLSATDEQQSTGPALTVTITQDDRPPAFAQITPALAADKVSQTTVISFRLNERVNTSAVQPFLVRQGALIPGTLTWAADSVSGTFTPSVMLPPNTIVTLYLLGAQDAAGNQDTLGLRSCFVTASPAASTVVVTDPAGDATAFTPPAKLTPADLIETRISRDNTLLTTIFQFTSARSFDTLSNSSGFIEFHVDGDLDTTGFWQVKGRGIGVDYSVLVEPRAEIGDSAGIVKWTHLDSSGLPDQGQFTAEFLPDYCGAFMAISLPFSLVGSTNGSLNAVWAAGAGTSNNFYYVDVSPNSGHTSVALPAPPAPPIAFGAGAPAVRSLTTERAVPAQVMRRLSRPFTMLRGN